MVTREQSMANARTAASVVARQLGIYENNGGGFRVADLSRENQVRLGDALADYVSRHPSLFDADAMASARYHLSLPLTGKPFVDPVANLGDYAEAILSQVEAGADAVAGVGRGVLKTFKLAEWVIPAVAIAVVGIAVFAFYNRTNAK